MIYLETNSDGSKSLGSINSTQKEGIGAIAQYQLMLYAICKKFNLQFYNSEFKNIGHSSYTDFDVKSWDTQFTKFFNFSTNKIIKNKIIFSDIDKEFLSFVEVHKNNSEDFLIYLEPENILRYGQSIINEIYEKKYLINLKYNFITDKKYFDPNFLNISFHIRKINIEDTSFQSSREYYNKEEIFRYLNLIQTIQELCKSELVAVHIHSQGSQEDFIEFLNFQKQNFKIIFHLNDNPINDIYHMSHADLLIMANSSFSWIAHLLNYNVSIVRDNFWHSTYPNTIKLNQNYSFDVKKLRII